MLRLGFCAFLCIFQVNVGNNDSLKKKKKKKKKAERGVWLVCVVDCFICWCTRASFVLLLLYFLFNVWYLKLQRPEKWFAGAILAWEAPEVGNLLFELLGKLRLKKCAFHDFRLFAVFFEPFLLINDFLLPLNLQEFRLWVWFLGPVWLSHGCRGYRWPVALALGARKQTTKFAFVVVKKHFKVGTLLFIWKFCRKLSIFASFSICGKKAAKIPIFLDQFSQNPVKIQSKSSQNPVKIQSKFGQNEFHSLFRTIFWPFFRAFLTIFRSFL